MAKISTEFLKRRLQAVNDRLEVLADYENKSSLEKERVALERAIDQREPIVEDVASTVEEEYENEPVIDFDAEYEDEPNIHEDK